MGQYERRNNPIVFLFFNKLSNRKKEPMATLKTTIRFVAENVSIFMLPIFSLPLVNDLGPASTLENQGFPRNKCALHALLGRLAADRQTSRPHAKNIPISTLNLTYKNNNKKTYKNQSLF